MINIIELFAGVGSQTQALKNIGVEHEVVGIAEIDKYAIQAYTSLHGNVNNFGDISFIQRLPSADLWTYSFPCQDISVAGNGAGIKEGTRSGLLLEVERLLEVSEKPKYLLMENVKNLIGKKHKADFNKWCQKLEELGYTNYWKVLNAKDFGVPQNRERVFMVSILGEHEPYIFPQGFPLTKRLKDILEEEVDEKYYLSDEYMQRFLKSKPISNTDIKIIGTTVGTGEGTNCRHWVHDTSGITGALSATDYKQPKQILEPKRLGGVFDKDGKRHQAGSVWDKEYVAPTLDTMQGGYREPLICASRGRNPENPSDRTVGAPTEQRLEVNHKGLSNTITTVQKDNYVLEPNFRIRKLTPRECWRLMGWKDSEFDKVNWLSNTQLYKQAGNGIVVDVLEHIFRNLFL